MRLNRAYFLPLLLAGCTAAADDQKAHTDANQAEKLRELQTRVEKLEQRAVAYPTGAGSTAPVAGATVEPGNGERLRKLERAEVDREYESSQQRLKETLSK